MKDIIIKSGSLKKELYILLICFGVAYILNIVSIIIYKTSWKELITSIGYVIVITFVLYFLAAIIRGIVKLIGLLFKKRIK